MANLGIIRGHIGMKLGRIGPWPKMEVPYGPFGFLATRGPILFTNKYTKLAVLGMITGHIGIKL